MRNRKRDIQYKILQGFYWMLYGLSTAYVTVFLLHHGFSSSIIGVIVAGSNLLAAVGQMFVGTMVDKHEKLTWKNMILLFCLLEAVCLILMMVLSNNHIVNGALFPIFSLLIYFQMPLVNSTFFYYTSRSEHLDFGSARGTGSLAYAIMSTVVGLIVVSYGEQAIVPSGMVILIGFTVVVLTMPYYHDELEGAIDTSNENTEDTIVSPNSSFIAFTRHYPRFMLVILGSILVMAFHNIVHTYLIQVMEAVGGNSATMGTAVSIEALVELPIMFGFFILIKKFSSSTLMVIAGIGFVIKSVCFLLASSVMAIYFTELVQLISFALFASASVYFANDMMEDYDRVKGQGYMTASIAIGGVVGNFLGGFIYDGAGVHVLLLSCLGFALVGALCILAGAMFKGKHKASLNS